MKYVCIIGIALFATIGCATSPQQQEQQAPTRAQLANEAEQNAKAYCDGLMADLSLGPLRSKVVVGAGAPTFDMLANETYATQSERRAIREWAMRVMQCQEAFRKIHQQYKTPMHLVIFSSTMDAANALRVRLHNGQLTFGQYNRERQR